MKRLRVFIAVTPPKNLQDKIGKIQEQLKKKGFPISWEDPGKTHITLVFLGHITQARMEAAATAAEKTCVNFHPFEAQIFGLSYFFKKGKDAIIFLGVKDPKKNFRRLYKELFKNLSSEGFYPPKRFTPHITLGRLKKQRRPHEKKKILSEIAETVVPDAGSFRVEQLDLYESIYDADSNKQRYHLLKSFVLTKVGV